MDILRARELVAPQSPQAATGGPPKPAAGGRADRHIPGSGAVSPSGPARRSRVRWCGVVVWRFQQFQVRVTGLPRRMLPPVSTEAYTPTLTVLC